MQNPSSSRPKAIPIPIYPSSSGQPGTSAVSRVVKRSYDPANRPLTLRPGGIMRHRIQRTTLDEIATIESDPRTDELFTRFMVTHGLTYDSVCDRTFKELVMHLNPNCVIPMPRVLEASTERLGNPGKPTVNYQKTIGPLSVTVDVAGNQDDKYLAFSIHFFEDVYERKNVVYLRKLMLSEIDTESIMISIRRAVNNYSYANVKFTNLVSPSQEIHEVLNTRSDIVKRGYVCFYHFVTKFVESLLTIDEFAVGLDELRTFVRFVKKHSDLYSKFRRMQLSKNAELDLPSVDNGGWQTTNVFLTRCLILHDTFYDFADRWRLTSYISHETFNKLVYFQRILQQCVKYSRELSVPQSTISQVVPAIMSMRYFISSHTMGYRFEKNIREAFTRSFQELTSGRLSSRYDIASLLDPRYGYKENVYTHAIWLSIEKKLVEEFATTEMSSERSFFTDITPITREERISILTMEIRKYRQMCIVERIEDGDSPFHWWGKRQTNMEFLAVLAREYLACPAVSIDADYHFGEGGKFSHLCKSYNYQVLENCLNVAGSHQPFRGRGTSVDNIPPYLLEVLNNTAYRRQKQCKLGLFAKGIDHVATDSEVAELLGKEITPPPAEEEPHTKKARMDEPEPSRKQSSEPREEQKASVLISDVKQEETAVFLEKVKDEPLDEEEDIELVATPPIHMQSSSTRVPYQKPIILHSKQTLTVPASSITRQTAPIPRLPTQPGTSPQVIQGHSFVQKFAQKQTFVPKFMKKGDAPLTLLPTGYKLTMPVKTQLKLPHTEEKPTDISIGSSSAPAPVAAPAAAPAGAIKEVKQEEGVEVKRELNSTSDFEEEDMEFGHSLYREVTLTLPQVQNDPPAMTPRTPYAEKRKPCNRRCAVCNHMEEHENLKNVTIDTEKLMVVLGAVYRKELSIVEARACLNRPTKTYMCRLHFAEACDEIFLMLHVTTPDEIAVVPQDMITNALMTVTSIRGRYMTPSELRQLLIVFSEKYYEAPTLEDFSTSLVESVEPGSLPEDDNDTDDHEIIPKSFRQPRKQVLEEDQHDATVKLIEQEDFKLPKVKTAAAEPDCQNPELCCFCSTRATKGTMLRVPRSEDRLARWLDKLGPEFAERLKPDTDNFICRNHFSDSSFSTRGRLLRGMLPSVAPEKVEVTYKIQGSSFLKLNEAKSGTDKNASIDLAHGVVPKTQYKDDFEEEPEYEEQDGLSKGDSDFAPAPRPVGRPRKYPIGVTKCVRKSFIAEEKTNRRKSARASTSTKKSQQDK